ncbi:putative WEB family protein At1g65010, chloroplastic [Zingiber officinale]|uniref:putative WEB family protein At1g65010, chloroplastic n=1 Tax=Zingiber officinale TaxID=94328 RepID=UPI001C4BE4E3|nr:putative WEB family protein At1g65010, chloroplastic [Zingiber officinale]
MESQSKTTEGPSSSLDSSDPGSFNKTAHSLSKQRPRSSDLQQQLKKLQEELRKEKEEKSRVMQQLTSLKKNPASEGFTDESKSIVESLEKEVQKAKESERKLHGSLASQTKLLEQINISLEEAKLENKFLRENSKSLESSRRFGSRSLRNIEKHLFGNDLVRIGSAEEDIRTLRNELRLSTEAEEKSKTAMDGLASVLKEVTTESNQVKGKLKSTESELEKARGEAEDLKAQLRSMEEKFEAASEESERLKYELEESSTAWGEKENCFINCIKMSEEEITELKADNNKLFRSQRSAREENFNLRDILKQAVNEASIVKESLEIVRKDNTELKDLLSQKEKELQGLKQEYECLKVSEAAATDSVKELKSLLAATSTMVSSMGAPSNESEPFAISDGDAGKLLAKFSSERWPGHSKQLQHGPRHSIGEPGKLRTYEIKVASSIVSDYEQSVNHDVFDRIDASHLDDTEQPAVNQKKKTFLRRFGESFRRKRS